MNTPGIPIDPVSPSIALMTFTKPQRKPTSTEDKLILESATPHYFSYRGLRLQAWSWGQGPSVLLVHGWESRASHMSSFLPALLSAGFRVVSFDAPAHGDSEGNVTDVLDYGKSIVAAAKYFGEINAVIAHSVGSAASLYAYAHGVNVKASVQISGPSSLIRTIERTGQMLNLPATEIAEIKRLFEQHTRVPLSAMEISELQSGLIHPALIIHDKQDQMVSVSESMFLSESWPGSTLSIHSGLGHKKILKDPEVIRSAVKFISESLQ